jgi:cytochrome c oxidase accessory protein FixG
MCPYARFQAVMFDSNTLTVTYDAKRGEPRGSRKKEADPEELGLGACVNCELCVQVCPTGIDIRDGLQYECIGCALCIDACDSVMEQMGYAPKLISYTTENTLAGKPVKFFRGRVIGYGLAILIMTSLFLFKVATREPFEVSILRDRQELAIAREDNIENRYTFKVSNKTQQPDTYHISITDTGYTIIGNTTFTVEPGETWSTPTRVLHKKEGLDFQSDINFIIESKNTGKKETRPSSFFNVSP